MSVSRPSAFITAKGTRSRGIIRKSARHSRAAVYSTIKVAIKGQLFLQEQTLNFENKKS
jgi:hypothetical protein